MSDVRAVRDDPDLGHVPFEAEHMPFEGEYVIASEHIYRVNRNGDVEIVGSTATVLVLT